MIPGVTVVDITLRRHPYVLIETSEGFVRWAVWLEREATRLRAGKFWRECLVYDMVPHSVGLVGVPREGEPYRICHEEGWLYDLPETRVA
jgi:hypothetical protein